MDKKRRIFSDEFKRERVLEIERKEMTVSEIHRMYDVGFTAIYRWMECYGKKYKKGVRMVVECESESAKRKALEAKVADLERMLGRKQVEIEYLNRVIVEGGKLAGCDLKKKLETQC